MTGASGELGPSLVEAFLALGAEVLAADRHRTALDDLRAQMRHHERLDVAECDVADAEGVEALFDAWVRRGDPDVVVHAADARWEGRLEDTEDAALAQLLDGTARTAALVLRAALRRMRPKGRGSVIVVSSARGAEPSEEAALYGAAHAAVQHLVRATAKGGGVRVNALLAGPPPEDEEAAARRPTDIARAAVWLASDESDGINGACVRSS